MYIFLLIFVKEYHNLGASLVAQCKTKRKRKICLQMKVMWIQSLGQEDFLEEEITTHSNILVWKIPWTEEPGELHFNSVQFSHSVVSDSLQPHWLQHTRLSYPSPTPGAYSHWCALSRWCPPTISSSVVPFSSCPQSLPASGYFPMSQLFESGGQMIGVSASTSVLPMNTQDWSPLGWTGWISL